MYRTIEASELRIDKALGYVYFLDKKHPLASGSAHRVYYHRHIVSIHLNRWIDSSEHVHHIDHNKLNNNIANLRTLSNGEHTKLHNLEVGLPPPVDKYCIICGHKIGPDSLKYCSVKCSYLAKVRDKTITKEMLDELIPTHTWIALGKLFGYSDSGIKKRARALGCNMPVKQKYRRTI